ncbi:NACHT domain-containing protein [Streptomyces sp. NPDC049879]|uniref:NACHT domain-containing protein n=1 Tax=Streptomyces sp. NPDC049879 TaxID=3365598 RepID=UPI00379B78DD
MPEAPEPPSIRNVMSGGTAEYVIQIGQVHGDVTVHVPPPRDPVDRAAHALARVVRAQWSAELRAQDAAAADEPLPVRWHADRPGPRAAAPGQDGSVSRLADALLALERRRLVVLGPPGSGKSTLAVLLTLDLAARRSRGEPVPVPVPLTLESFDPFREDFHRWVVRRVTEEYPGLPAVEGAAPARRLVGEGLLLPVLDGLDELPEHRRADVVRAVDAALGPEHPVVLASRTEAYAAVRASGAEITRAVTLHAQPVDLADATRYLVRSARSPVRDRWAWTAAALAAAPDGPVARTLTSPLMIWLARRAYETPPADPCDLLTRRFPVVADVEHHLLDAVFAATFTERPQSLERLHAPGRWHPDRARHWLTALARHLDRRHTTELAWWRLHRTPLVLALLPLVLLAAGLALSVPVDAFIAWYGDRRSDPGFDWGATELGMETSLAMGMTLCFLMWRSTEFWFGSRLWQPRRRANPFRIGAALRSARRPVAVRRGLAAALVIVVPTAGLGLIVAGASDTRPYLVMIVTGCVLAPLAMAVIAAPADTEDAATPGELLRGERRAALLSAGVVAPLFGVGQGAFGWFWGGTAADALARGAVGWLGPAALLVLLSPWSRWLFAKAALATVGRVPWSLMEFLRDAHRGGLLQQSGGVYRFRHLRLQEHLTRAHAAASAVTPVPLQSPRPPAEAPWQHPTQAVPPPRPARPSPEPMPSLRTTLLAAERQPLAARKHWTVLEDSPAAFRAVGRERRVVMAHWPVFVFISGLTLLRGAISGSWATGVGGAVAWLLLALLVSFLSWLLKPPLRTELHITADHLLFAIGRRHGWSAWNDVDAVVLRRVMRRGRDSKVYGVHVHLRPGAAPLHRALHSGGGWYCVLPLSVVRAVPDDLAAALARFAGPRWRPPPG